MQQIHPLQLTKKHVFALIIIICTLSSSAAHSAPLFLGIIEQPQTRDSDTFVVRVLFKKQSNEWKALSDFQSANSIGPLPNQWTIAFDGKTLGKISLADPAPTYDHPGDWFYTRDHFYPVDDSHPIPKMQNTKQRFDGWVMTPQYRPLAIVSKPNFQDPKSWQPCEPSKEDLDLLVGPFKKHVFDNHPCPNVPTDAFHKLQSVFSYKNSKGDKLISVGVDSSIFEHCQVLGNEYVPIWFLVSGEIKHLGTQLDLIDVGDYDGDGSVEFLFWHGGYNRDGYVMYYSNFSKKIEYFWSYH